MSKRKVLITQSNYVPWKGYFDSINFVDVVVLYDDMQYTRRDWRNRNIIKTANGTQWITIPVEVKGKYFQKINETKIADPRWADAHWQTLRHAYGKAPCFSTVKDFVEPLYRNCKEEYLSQVNYRFLKACCDFLGITTEFRWSSEFELKGDRSEKLLNICQELGADVYYSGPAAKEYMDVALFERNNIKVEWLDYSGYPEYPQLFGHFVHGVSILDLLFNTGDNARAYMKSFLDG